MNLYTIVFTRYSMINTLIQNLFKQHYKHVQFLTK